MNLVTKANSVFLGLQLTLRYSKQFDVGVLKGKRIALVGPASSAYGTDRGSYINSFDYVIRINKSPIVVNEAKHASDIGTKTDILFHSFFENDFSGGGPLNFELYDKLGIKYVVNPIPVYFGRRVTFNFYKKYHLRRITYYLSKAFYNQSIKGFHKFRPTTGFFALRMALESEFSELFITGFTFFKTSYGDGYRDALKDIDVNKKYIQESNIHSPDIEYAQFKTLLYANRHKHIFTDNELKKILAQDGVELDEANS